VETGSSPKALQVGDLQPVAASCCCEIEKELVARTDRGLAEADTSSKRGATRVARDHLSKPLCAGAGRAEAGADGLSAISAPLPALAPCNTKRGKQGQIVDAVSISERPASVEDRAVPGHWEGDLICGPNNSNIVTLVERHSRYVMLARIPSRDTQTVVNTLIRQVRKLPDELYKSLTWDRGKELADHKRFTMETNIDVCFCDPHSPWQRGSNENTNRLLRQYFPKGTDLSSFSQAHLNKVARQLNERPRKTLDFQSPAERFSECVASSRLSPPALNCRSPFKLGRQRSWAGH